MNPLGLPGTLWAMPLLPKTKSRRALEMLTSLQEQMSRMRTDFDSRLDVMTEALESRRADEEAEAIAAERVRSGAAERTEDGAKALGELGIDVR